MKGAIVAETSLARQSCTLITQAGGMLALVQVEDSISNASRQVQ
jgi:hypothetical protein